MRATRMGAMRSVLRPARRRMRWLFCSVCSHLPCRRMPDPPKAMVECKGTAKSTRGATSKCDASTSSSSAEFTGPTVACEGSCEGTCESSAARSQSGTCEGTCSSLLRNDRRRGARNATAPATHVREGSCEAKVDTPSAKCSGTCNGSSTITNRELVAPARHTRSAAPKASAMVMCEGKCDEESESRRPRRAPSATPAPRPKPASLRAVHASHAER